MNYHPDIELLLKYSNGAIEPALSVAIGLHQQQCSLCQQRVADLELMAGNHLEELNDSEIELTGFDKLLANLDDLDKLPEQSVLSLQANIDSLSLAVAESDLNLLDKLANLNIDDLNWQKVTRKISRAEIEMNDSVFQVELMKFTANAKIPKHTHLGREFTVVLQGDFSDHQGVYQSGEFISQDSSNEHQPIAGKDGCICLAITDAPLKFTGLFGPIINWMAH